MIKKYRKKPIVIEACLWDESKETFSKIGCKLMSANTHTNKPNLLADLKIETPQGSASIEKGDYIIKGIKGEFYPCKPDIFEATYEQEYSIADEVLAKMEAFVEVISEAEFEFTYKKDE